MKNKVRVSLVQFAPEWLQRDHNAARMKALAEEQAAKGAELIVFPELSNVGYVTPIVPGEAVAYPAAKSYSDFASAYAMASEPVPGPTTELLAEVARERGVYIVVGLSQIHPVIPGTLFNSGVLIGPSGIAGIHHKMHLPLNEKLFFYPGEECNAYPTSLGTIGMSICYDARFPETGRIMGLKGAEIICSIWGIVKAAKDVAVDQDTLRYRSYTRAQENGVYYLSCNRTGQEGPTVYAGRSVIAGPDGSLIAWTDSDKEEALTADLFGEQIVRYRTLWTVYQDRRPELYGALVEPFSRPSHPQPARNVAQDKTGGAQEARVSTHGHGVPDKNAA